MNTGQTMLAMGAMMLLSFLVLRFNSVHLTSAQSSYNAKFGIVATSLANSLIEEAKDKAFDKVALDTTIAINSPTVFSTTLGPDGETYPNFNDFDDYNNLVFYDDKSLTNPQTGAASVFEIRAKVNYVDDTTDPLTITNTKTYHKQIVVSVFNPSMLDTVKVSTIYSYWYLLD